MNRLKRILFPTDFSRCADQALVPAVDLAAQYGAELHVFHAVVLFGYDPFNPKYRIDDVEDEIHRRIGSDAAERLAGIRPDDLDDEVKVVTTSERGLSASQLIVEYASEHDIDLVVMGTHGRRSPVHLPLGSVAEEVVRKAGCPVLTVREREQPRPLDETDRILVPVDYSEHATRALSDAKHLAADFGASLQLLHVIEQTPHPAFYATSMTSLFDIDPDLRQRSHDELLRLASEAPGPEVHATPHVIEGRAASDIVEFTAEHDSDLIVIPTHGLTGLKRFLLGSIAQKVVRRAPCPVLVVKAFGRALS